MFFERHGASKPPLTFLPRIPPRIVRGNPTGRERGREREREGERERDHTNNTNSLSRQEYCFSIETVEKCLRSQPLI